MCVWGGGGGGGCRVLSLYENVCMCFVLPLFHCVFSLYEGILVDHEKIEKVTEFKYLGQTTRLRGTTKEEIYARIRPAWSCFGKNKEILQDRQLPISHKKTSEEPICLANNG